MPYRTLRDFVEALDTAGELKTVTGAVSPILEAPEIADRVSKRPAARSSPHAAAFDPHHHHLGGRALLFRSVEGCRSDVPLLMNAFGSYRRMEMALGCEGPAGSKQGGGFEALAQRIGELVKPEPPVGLMNKMKKGLELARIAGMGPKVVKRGVCQEVVRKSPHAAEGPSGSGGEFNLLELPVIKCWPHDGDPAAMGFDIDAQQSRTAAGDGRYITLAGIYTIHPDDAGKPAGEPRPSRNIGMYRMQLVDSTHTCMHWHMHHDGARHWRAWKKRRAEDPEFAARYPGMPCAVVLGGESLLPYAATAPLPPGISELLFAGFLNDGPIELVKCITQDLEVPANAELVIEGYVSTEAGPIGLTNDHFRLPIGTPDTAENRRAAIDRAIGPGAAFEGPFGDHTGFYSLPDRYPIFTATALTHRAGEGTGGPIYPATVVGYPPQEDYYLGKATERLFLPLLKTLIPDIIDYDLPMFGAFHNCAFVQIRKEYPLQARRVMHAIWGAGQMAWTKAIVVVDHDVNVHDHEAVLFHLAANCDPGRDLEIVNGPLDILDHAAPRLAAGHKIGLDATRKWPGEEVNGQPVRDFPPFLSMTNAIKERVTQRWSELGLD